MANLALIRGARDAANKFVDVTGVVRQAVLRGEAAFLRQEALERAEKEKSEAFRLQLLARGDTLQKSKIAPEMQGYATNKAMQLQQQFRQTLLDPNVSKEDQVIALQNYNSQIDEITSFNQQFLEFQDNFRKLETSQLSDLNDAERLSNARMIATGQFQWDGENFILGEGENKKMVNAQELFAEGNQEIIKETVGYNKLLADFQSLGLEQGYKKVPEELFDQMVEQKFKGSDINQMNNAGLASIVVDYISNESVDKETESDNMQQKQMLKEALKQDYADDGLLNASSTDVKQIVSDSGLPYREYLLNYIKDNVKKAVKTQYNIGFNNAPADPVKSPGKDTEAERKRKIALQSAQLRSNKLASSSIRKDLGFNVNQAGIIVGNPNQYKVPTTNDQTFLGALNKLGIDAAFIANEKDEIKELEMREQTTNRKVKLRTANTSLVQVVISAFKLTGISDVDAEIKANEILYGGKGVIIPSQKELEIRDELPATAKTKVDETFFDDTVSAQEKRDLPKQVKRRLNMSSVNQEFTRTQINEAIRQINEELKTNFKEI
tara:strand:+ start:87 stop:1739 length:1653 start_codon:yes stop_codon:yes gene_type:complete